MLQKTRGIVLHNIAYNDSYVIVPVYTEEFGLMSYFVPRNRSRKSRSSPLLFQSLAVLDLEVEHFPLRDIHKIKEARRHVVLSGLLFNPMKSTICLFLAELIYNVSKDVQSNRLLFGFMLESMHVLDLLETGIANFHLVFMIRMSHFLGFYPDAGTYKEGARFDLQEGVFVQHMESFHSYLDAEESRVFMLLLRMNYENMSRFRFSRHERVHVIHRILEFYRMHLVNFPDMKSLAVLQDVFN